MIFVILGIAILTASFVIAFVSLLREQKTLKENPKTVEEDELVAKVKKIPFKKTEEIEAIHKTKNHRVIYHGEGATDDRFPWEEPVKKLSSVEEQSQKVSDKEEETINTGQKLGGEISISDLVRRRKAQKESVSK